MGVDVIVSALENEEERLLELTREQEFCQAQGIEFISFPIADGTVPTSEKAVGELVLLLEARLAAGKNVAIHCRAGIGRCVVLAACTLALGGVEPETAFQKMRQARGCHVPDKKEQEVWVKRFAETVSNSRR
jgi:protein-tyrosine phosphatase